MNDRIRDIGHKTKEAAANVSDKVSKTVGVVKESAQTVAITILDQDGDGKVSQDDVKIITEKGKVLAEKAADEVISIAKEAKKSNLLMEAAAGAIVGALIAIPVPFIGPLYGAAIGASIGLYAHVVRAGRKK